MRKINIYDFDYICYVDGSGNDGDKYDVANGGSSTCFTAAYIMIKVSEHDQNVAILSNIKNFLGTGYRDEIKYKTIRRHKNKWAIYKELSKIKGTAGSHTCFKRDVRESYLRDVKSKKLTSFVHSMVISNINEDVSGRVLIVMDMMKNIEMELINLLNNDKQIIFRDSKDVNFPFIQIADVLAGMTREFFEWSLTAEAHRKIGNRCKVCHAKKKLCAHEKKYTKLLRAVPLMKTIPLYQIEGSRQVRIDVYPPKMLKEYYYLSCL
jgi:hypothetical protein